MLWSLLVNVLWFQWSMDSSYMAGDWRFTRHSWSGQMPDINSAIKFSHTLDHNIIGSIHTLLCTLGCPGLFTCVGAGEPLRDSELWDTVKSGEVFASPVKLFPNTRGTFPIYFTHVQGQYRPGSWSRERLVIKENLANLQRSCYWTWVENKMAKENVWFSVTKVFWLLICSFKHAVHLISPCPSLHCIEEYLNRWLSCLAKQKFLMRIEIRPLFLSV